MKLGHESSMLLTTPAGTVARQPLAKPPQRPLPAPAVLQVVSMEPVPAVLMKPYLLNMLADVMDEACQPVFKQLFK